MISATMRAPFRLTAGACLATLIACLGAPAPPATAGAVLRINEINANIASGCDLVELRATLCGSMNGIQLWHRSGPLVTFGAFDVQAEDLVVVHVNGGLAECNAASSPSETASPVQFPAASHPGNYDTAYDWYSAAVTPTGIAATSNALVLYDSTGVILDAVLLTDGLSLPSAETTRLVEAVVAAGEWSPPTMELFDFIFYAARDLNATGTTAGGRSLQRSDNSDDDDQTDWTPIDGVPSTWGTLNEGQVAAFSCVLGVPRAATRPGLRLEAHPRVASGPVRFRLGAPATEPARLEVFDAQGRLAALLWIWPGAQAVTWDGRDLGGRAAAAGAYFARVSTARASAVARVTLLR